MNQQASTKRHMHQPPPRVRHVSNAPADTSFKTSSMARAYAYTIAPHMACPTQSGDAPCVGRRGEMTEVKYELSVEVEVEVWCSGCGRGICGNASAVDWKGVSVEPCESCMRCEYDRGYNDGCADAEEGK